MRVLGLGLTIIAALLLALFAVSNRGTTDIDLWPFALAISLPLYLVVLGALVVGIIVGRISHWPKYYRLRAEHRRVTKKLAVIEASSARPDEPAPKSATGTSLAA